jgi:hypothetical protein
MVPNKKSWCIGARSAKITMRGSFTSPLTLSTIAMLNPLKNMGLYKARDA